MDLLKKMLSIPPELPLTSTQRFTYVSAFFAYILVGLTMTFAPDLWNVVLRMDFGAGGRAYFVLVGSEMVDIGFCMIVLARNKASQVPNARPILRTIFNRPLLVNAFSISLYTQGILNARFAGMIIALDTTLATITYVIWSRENTDVSLTKFFQDICSTMNSLSPRPPRYQVFLMLGFVQVIVNFVAPSILLFSGIVPSSIEGRHAEGLFRAYFVIRTILAIFQVFTADSQNDSYPIVSVLYRLAWNIPVILVMSFSSQIPVGLAKILVISDVMVIALTIVIFKGGDHAKTN